MTKIKVTRVKVSTFFFFLPNQPGKSELEAQKKRIQIAQWAKRVSPLSTDKSSKGRVDASREPSDKGANLLLCDQNKRHSFPSFLPLAVTSLPEVREEEEKRKKCV